MKGNILTVGAYLKEKREQKGISIEEISSKTRIAVSVLQALELNVTEDLPEPVFVKGFIKSYAQVLGIDYLKPISIYEKTLPSSNIFDSKQKLDFDLKLSRIIPVFVIIVIFAITWYAYTKQSKQNDTEIKQNSKTLTETPEQKQVLKSKILKKKAKLKASVLKVKENKLKDSTEDKKIDKTEILKKENKSTNISTKTESLENHEEKQEEQNNSEQKENTELIKNIEQNKQELDQLKKTVQIMAKRVVWVKVQIDDQEAFDFMMQPSANKLFKYEKEIKFLFGDAGAIDILYQGKPFSFKNKVGAVRTIIFPSLERWKGAMDV